MKWYEMLNYLKNAFLNGIFFLSVSLIYRKPTSTECISTKQTFVKSISLNKYWNIDSKHTLKLNKTFMINAEIQPMFAHLPHVLFKKNFIWNSYLSLHLRLTRINSLFYICFFKITCYNQNKVTNREKNAQGNSIKRADWIIEWNEFP